MMTTEGHPHETAGTTNHKPDPEHVSEPLLVSRREMLKRLGRAGAGLWGLTAMGGWGTPAGDQRQRRARALIQVWLAGGLSHVDTFDPKPEAGPQICGPWTGSLATHVPGVRLGLKLPRLARQADKFCVIRSMTHDCEDHLRATRLMRWGWDPGRETDSAQLAGMISWPNRNEKTGTGSGLVPWILPPEPSGADTASVAEPGLVWWVPRSIRELLGGKEDSPARTRSWRMDESLSDGTFAVPGPTWLRGWEVCVHAVPEWPGAYGRRTTTMDVRRVQGSGKLRAEPKRCGSHAFARACEWALRLVQFGVETVVVEFRGWDTHREHFRFMERKLGELDEGLAGLLEGLAVEGLLRETVVWVGGEFGRSPRVKWDPPWSGGRDHWNRAFSVLLAGGGIRGGQVVGATNRTGEEVVDRPVHPAELVGSVATLLGKTARWTLPDRPSPGRAELRQSSGAPGLLREIADVA